ncbi:MAG: CCA tRNA nucleotidyltransferase [Christensenellales bacterium]|jgi:tRNA nucleotidyltransferase (CCA-adding enzyme)
MRLEPEPFFTNLAGLFNPHAVYLVGGRVRNRLLGIYGGDLDIASVLSPAQLTAALSGTSIRIIKKAPEFGTVELHMPWQGEILIFEHTTFRQDSYPKGGAHRPSEVSFTHSLQKDALRRDFTINALYMDCATGEIQDPLDGIGDLSHRLIRAAKSPAKTLADDSVRILRMVRFACELGFQIQPALRQAAQQNIGLLTDISKERIQQEFTKILLSDTKYPTLTAKNPSPVLEGLMQLKDLGAFRFIIAELCAGKGIVQKSQYHAFDVLDHGLHVAACTPPKLSLRLAGLLHDAGKSFVLKKSGTMYGHDKLSAQIAQVALGQAGLRYDNRTLRHCCRLIEKHMFDLNGQAKPLTVRRTLASLGREGAQDLIHLRRADVVGSGRTTDCPTADKWQQELNAMLEQNAPFSIRELAISGHDIMQALGIGPGPEIARIQRALLNLCLKNPARNRKDCLLHAVRSYRRG